jgi:hypothetical protein
MGISCSAKRAGRDAGLDISNSAVNSLMKIGEKICASLPFLLLLIFLMHSLCEKVIESRCSTGNWRLLKDYLTLNLTSALRNCRRHVFMQRCCGTQDC